MKQFIMLGCVLFITTYSFANTPTDLKNISFTNSLGSALRTRISSPLNINNDITIVYGGEDISSKPALGTHTALA